MTPIPLQETQLAELFRLRQQVLEQAAQIAMLRSALQFYMDNGICESLYYKARKALSITPSQALIQYRNDVLEEAAKVCAKINTIGSAIAEGQIRAMKEQP